MQRIKVRQVGLVVSSLVAVAVWTVAISLPESQEQTQKLPRVRGRCQVCHRAEAMEWAQSHHAKAWKSETFVQATNNRAQKECLSCHAPEKILVTGLGKEPKLREEGQEHGVDCVSCHEDADGAHHGTLGTQPEEHPVVKNEKFGTVEQCATCHAKFGTVDEFKQTKWGGDDKACVTCHMPEAKRPIAISVGGEELPARTAHAHTVKGADPEQFKKGVKVEVSVSGDRLIVKMTSAEVGHNFPTGVDFIVAVVDVRLISGGQEVLKHQTLLANDTAKGGSDTRLKPGEMREIAVPLNGKKGEAVVRLLHKSLRDLPDEKATVLFETKVPVGP